MDARTSSSHATKRVAGARRAAGAVVAGALLAAFAGPTSAAGSGCPAGGWEATSVTDAAARIYPHLLGKPPGGLVEFEAIVGGDDRDGDGRVCLKEQWGESLNARSHWYLVGMAVLGEPTHAFIVHDDTASASD